MYVCICNEVTDKDIKNAVGKGASTLQDLRKELNVATCCGSCAGCAKGFLNQANTSKTTTLSS